MRQYMHVDAKDKFDRTPLSIALSYHRKGLVELLLRNGADPYLVNADRLTPYWLIIRQEPYDDDLAKSFFETCVEIQLPVQVDARNRFGQTPLQWAVTSLKPHMVDVILDHGADLSSFVFPRLNYFGKRLRPKPCEGHMFKLRLASSVLIIVENLERRGYELDRSDALKIMKSFVEHQSCEMFEDSNRRQHRWYDDDEFVNKSKEIMMNPSLSLYELIRLRPDEAEKSLTYTDYLNFACSNKLSGLPELDKKTCAEHLCEKLARGIFRSWALDFFLNLTKYRFPILCCEMIIDNLKNKDLLNICLAGTESNWIFDSDIVRCWFFNAENFLFHLNKPLW
uniref:SOCS box domain-containing protein n=1 Tax=Trichogramma kaykai TaxID=54128 RepID=A0ABD2WHR8_9HYME